MSWGTSSHQMPTQSKLTYTNLQKPLVFQHYVLKFLK